MARRIEVELTSRREDGSWTWRAAGARQPKGDIDHALLPEGAKVGDVLRAEADFDIEGITLLSILPAKESRPEPDRIELIGPAPRSDDSLVTSSLVTTGRSDSRGSDRPRRGGPGRGAGDDGGSPGQRDRAGRGPRRGARDDRRPDGAPAGEEGRRRRRRDRRGDHPVPAETEDRGESTSHAPGDGGATTGPRRPRRERPPRTPSDESDGRKPKRLRPGRQHRKAVLEALPAEQRPIAEQVLVGGIPSVRQAVERQNEELRAGGQPEVRAEPLVAIAEELLPRLRTAEWRDRAEAALADVDELDLRDLRSVVVAADTAARNDQSRELAARLREALNRRVDEEHTRWLREMTVALADGRVVRALRLSSRPPKAGALLPPDLTGRLVAAASAALTADISADRWATVLDALSYSPVRRSVTPQSLPEPAGEELLGVVRKFASRLPDLAGKFGIEPAPAPIRRERAARPAHT
ncbi:MAG: hypothetical protein ACRD0U_02590 [Acidimicrobiales bacterium]